MLVPLAGVAWRAAGLDAGEIHAIVSSPRQRGAGWSFGTALAAAALSSVAGGLIAWVLVRYPCRETPVRCHDRSALRAADRRRRHRADGAVCTARLAGSMLEPLGIKVAYSPLGIVVACVFIGLPFVVRSVQPVLQEAERELEEAAAALGATRWQTVTRVLFPSVLPALLTGFALAFARAVGEYGSIIFIAGNLPGVSEIAPLLIIIKLEEYDYAGASAIAFVMLVLAFVVLVTINLLQAWAMRRHGRSGIA